ncbi:MAG: hydroxyacylglutathione hydrolase [Alphaproteobacteria bacterium]|nr:hydroxyacylglutathione hydrolase [Alphaproteobacteria bacterium]
MTRLVIEAVPALKDNYVWLAREPGAGVTAVVDPAEPGPVVAALERHGWRLDVILNTHHHGDHVGGNRALKEKYGCKIVGPAADRERIPLIDQAVAEGERVALGDQQAEVFDIPGHTRGHIAYWFAASEALFCGDTIFSLGCGRLFEGDPKTMWHSIGKLRRLPDATRVFCAHEYTQSNARFALTVDPDNPALRARVAEVDRLRAAGQSTVPSLLGVEKAANPFLRADDPVLARNVGLAGADAVAVFGEVRGRKDRF